MNTNETWDFSCWVIKYLHSRINGRTYQTDSLKSSGDVVVPLLWNHDHSNPDSVIGNARLEHNNLGVYAYCTLNDSRYSETIMQLLQDKGTLSLSPYINHVKFDGKNIVHGLIAEVSLVMARIDPDEAYYPVMKKE